MLENYDVIAGIGFGLVNDILSGLYDSYAIPHNVAISSVLNQHPQEAVRLRTNLMGIPKDAVLGDLRVVRTPSVREVPTTPYVMVQGPFSFDFSTTGPVPATATLSGSLYFPAICGASSRNGTLVFEISALTGPLPPGVPAASLHVPAASVVQPVSDQAAGTVAGILSEVLAPFLLDSVVVSPILSIPKFPVSANQTHSIVDVRTSTPHTGQVGPEPAILAAVQFPGDARPAVDPAAILDLKTTYNANLYVWVNSSSVHSAPYQARLQATQGKALISQAPVNQTELAPTVTQLVITSENSVLAATVYVKLSPDEVDRFVYARFLGKPFGMFDATPLRLATVQLCDLDAPAPPHDDAVIPQTGTTTKVTGKFTETTTTTFQPPKSNQVLGTARTNLDGRVLFALQPGAGSFAGQAEIDTEQREPGGPPVESSRQYTVTETYPDLFFKVSAPDILGDTLKLPNGLFVNYAGKRLGTPAAPVTYTLTYAQESTPNLA